MHQTRFLGLDAHRLEHAKLVDAVRKLQAEQLSGKIAISLDIMKFLKQWLSGHIADSDQQYQAHLTAAGVR